MAKDVNLLSYWMPLLRKLKEFKQIAIAEEPELKYILEAIDRTLANMFISTADEYGIKRFEGILGIYPADGASLETRRFNVLIKWNDKVPYTYKELYNRMLAICGSEDSFSIVRRFDEYAIDIYTELKSSEAFSAISDLLVTMIPCNLVLTLKNLIKAINTSTLSVGVVTCTAMVYQITNDINCEYVSTGILYYSEGLGSASTHTITHDVDLQDVLGFSLKQAVGMGTAYTKIITHDIASTVNEVGNSTVASPISTAMVSTIN